MRSGAIRVGALPLAFALAIGAAAAADGSPPQFDVGMRVQVAADGSVVSVTPEAGLPSSLRDGLAKQVSQWHYSPATWQGRPVSVESWLSLHVQAVPTSSGGFAVRIVGEGRTGEPGTAMQPPEFPHAARRAGVNATLVYRVHVAADGSMTPVARLFPEVARGHVKALDESSRQAILEFRRGPILADGVAVACEMNYPMTFSVGGGEPPAAPPLPQPENACPIARLETEYEGLML